MNPYLEQKILSAEPIELVIMLYQRAISSVREARSHLNAGRIAERGQSICNGYAAISELLTSLNDEAAPSIAKSLRHLYYYMQGKLLQAQYSQADEPLSEVVELLTTLSEAWNTIEKQQRAECCEGNVTQMDSPASIAGATAGQFAFNI